MLQGVNYGIKAQASADGKGTAFEKHGFLDGFGAVELRHEAGLADSGLTFDQDEARLGGLGVAEDQRGGTVMAGHLGQRVQIAGHRVAEVHPFVSDESRARQQQRHAAGQHDDEAQLAPDRDVAQIPHLSRFPLWRETQSWRGSGVAR